MQAPTDTEIFNHMLPDEEELEVCEKCGGDIEDYDGGYYTSYECLECGYCPAPPEED